MDVQPFMSHKNEENELVCVLNEPLIEQDYPTDQIGH